jgi:hypothetical protein
MRRVIIESPFAGPTPEIIARNIRYVRACMRDCLLRGESPYASHALYTLPGVLDDTKPDERKLGMEAGRAWMTIIDPELIVAPYTDLGVSPGMQWGIDNAKSWGRTVDMRQLGDAWDLDNDMETLHSMLIEPDAQELFKALEEAEGADRAQALQLGLMGTTRMVLRRALFNAFMKGRKSP